MRGSSPCPPPLTTAANSARLYTGKPRKGGVSVKTIAIIEDDQTIGDLLEEVLQKEGFQVKRAYSGT